MVIGDVPTALEAKNNKVMTGPGAGVLKQTLEKVGLDNKDKEVFYTTAIACAIPKQKGKKIPKEAILNCRNRLLNEIALVSPKLILVCGSTALQTLLGNTTIKITQEYGVAKKYPFCGEAIVIPIINPSLILRSPRDYKPFLLQLQYAASVFFGRDKKEESNLEFKILDTPEKMQDAWKMLKELKPSKVAIDIETTSLDYREAEFLVAGICYEKDKVFVIPRSQRKLYHNFIDNVPWKCIYHHGKYDKKITWARELGEANIDGDTIYMHYALDETSEHNLGYLSKTFLQAAEYKYKMNQNWKAVTLESYESFFDALCERVAVDCTYTYQLESVFAAALDKDPRLRSLYEELLIPASNFLSRVEQNGILVDADFLEDLNIKYAIELDKIKMHIAELSDPIWDVEQYVLDTGAKSKPLFFNPGSSQQMAWMVFDRLKLKPRIRKARSTDKIILNSIEPKPKLIVEVLNYRTVQKEKATYVEGLLNARDKDGRVRTTFNLHVAATGRLSSKEPNVQNQPSAHGIGNVRKAFISRPGYVLAEIDYSGAELRWLAFLSKCPVLMDVFRSGRNLHDETAIALYGVNYTKQEKMRAKAVNFGIPYGREAQSFVDEFQISKTEAEAMIAGWLDKYYGAKEYLNWCASQVREGKYLETPFKRRRRFGLVTPESIHSLENEARNFPIQSSSSDLLLVCAMEAEDTLLNLYDTKIINLVHDSLLLEIPKDRDTIASVNKYCESIMINKPIELFDCPIPFTTDFEVGLNWGELIEFDWKTKAAVDPEKEDELIKILL
jgi:DNA polymerase-1